MTAEKTNNKRKVLIEEMERVINDNRKLIVERTAARLKEVK